MKNSPQLRIEIISNWDQTFRLRSEWNSLLEACAAPSIFQTYEWLDAWWNAYGENKSLLLYAVRDYAGNLLAIAPLYQTKRLLTRALPAQMILLVGDGSGDSDQLNLIIRAGHETDCVAAILAALRDRSHWNILELNTLDLNSPATRALLHELSGPEWRVISEKLPQCGIVLPRKWEEYVSRLSKKMAQSFEYSTRRLFKQFKVELRRCETESELPVLLEEFFKLHTERWHREGSEGSFGVDQRRKFFQLFSERFLAAGFLDLSFLYLDGKAAAAELGFRYRDRYSYLQAGFAPAFEKYSVGLVLRGLIIKDLIKAKLKFYDFLGGEEAYKARYAAEKTQFLNLRCARARSIGSVYLEMAKTKHLARSLFSRKASHGRR
jgi:CelD/BcsL family acetyltransferase involved in cellulose biosynthesis